MFNIGQKVICIADHSLLPLYCTGLKKGKIYSIKGIDQCFECNVTLLDVGVGTIGMLYNNTCSCGAANPNPYRTHHTWRFRPIQDLNEELNNLLKQAIDEDRQFCREVDARTRTILSGDAA